MERVSKGAPVYLPVDASDAVYLVAVGRIKICHLTSEGKQSTLAFVDAGELFGESAVFNDGPREEYAEALKDSTVLRIPADRFSGFVRENADLAMGFAHLVSHRRQLVERRLKNLLYVSSRDRLSHLLLELSEKYGQAENGSLHLATGLSHQDLASMIGSTRETVTLGLGELQAEGLIKLGRRKITLLRPEEIRRCSKNLPRPAEPSELDTSRTAADGNHDVSRAG
jgi:CRP-like cAMP-binding protein